MSYQEFLTANRADIIETIQDEIQFTNVKLADVMKALAGSEAAYNDTLTTTQADLYSAELTAAHKMIKVICNRAKMNQPLMHDANFEAMQEKQIRNQSAGL